MSQTLLLHPYLTNLLLHSKIKMKPMRSQIKTLPEKTQFKTTNTTLKTKNSQIKALTVPIRDHKMALIVINLTMIAIFTHSQNICTLMDHHHNPVLTELDPSQNKDLFNTNQLIPLNPQNTQTETLLLKYLCITKLLRQLPVLRVVGFLTFTGQNLQMTAQSTPSKLELLVLLGKGASLSVLNVHPSH